MTGILAVENQDTGIHFFNLEPGFVVTELMRKVEDPLFVAEFGSMVQDRLSAQNQLLL
jgi:hypothetical protein